jgi:hypothetical protein
MSREITAVLCGCRGPAGTLPGRAEQAVLCPFPWLGCPLASTADRPLTMIFGARPVCAAKA